ncbi:MAG: hypothetical protein ACFFG0_45560 [Candidatus Thorarchaeota archaeon]
MAKKERELIEIKEIKNMWLLKELLDITTNKCYYCGKKLKKNKDKILIFNKPDRIICNSPLCICEALNEDD